MVVAAVFWAVTGVAWTLWAEHELAPVPSGPFQATGVMVSDVIPGRFGLWALIDNGSGPVLANLPEGVEASRGDEVYFIGNATGNPGMVRGERHRGAVEVGELEVIGGPGSPLVEAGNILRSRVIQALKPADPPRALLAGFLVGDTTRLDELDIEAMRRAGLSHFTAVSGSNVALFLGLLFLVAGPLSLGPKRRAIVGLLGLPVYAAATRFEPSVMRATLMAGVALVGRLFDVVLEAWQLLSVAVVGLLLLDPSLSTHVGFQLSVAATVGVLAGSRWPVGPGWLRRAFAVTLGAQTAVAPLLVAFFGTVPLLSPMVNVMAAPLVAGATVLGAIGVAGLDPMLEIAAWLADLVLTLARSASFWPQVGWEGIAGLIVAGIGYLWMRKVRGSIALAAALVVAAGMLGSGSSVPESGVVVLDVGQGDAILLSGGEGRFALVDGGPDPVTLIEQLASHRVRHLELVVITHAHADHIAGLEALAGGWRSGWYGRRCRIIRALTRSTCSTTWLAAAPLLVPLLSATLMTSVRWL